MHPNAQARSGYAAAARSAPPAAPNTRSSPRSPTACKAVDETDKAAFSAPRPGRPRQPAALGHARRGPDAATATRCRSPLRAQLISLAEFVRRHSLAVLGGRASVAPLIDINTAIMKGLRGEVEAAA